MSFKASHVVPVDRRTAWTWHTRPGALARLTPPFWPMTPIKQATHLANGTTVLGLPAGLKWIARHDLSGYVRGYQFTDVCVNAPLKSLANWRHTHEFFDHPDGCLIKDTVHTRLPKMALTSAFAYRQHQLIQDLSALNRFAALRKETSENPDQPLCIALSGSHGLVGRALKAQLETLGHKVIALVRSNPEEDERTWDPEHPAANLLEGCDALIHLAGEPIFGRFNDSHKQALRDSRVGPTKELATLVARTPGCDTMICASAVGFYGSSRGEEKLSETSEPGEGFLAQLCQDWEDACQPARDAGKRVVNVRTGVVMSGAGGMLPVLKALFSTGLGGAFAGQNPWMSWISHDDLGDIYIRALLDPRIEGPVNATAPNPVTNADMTADLGRLLHRPTWFPIPTIGPKLLLGKEGAQELALADQRVLPTVLQEAGHVFRYPIIGSCLAHELGNESLWSPGEVATLGG